ncbi:hypothetical protein DFH11DRAFT_933278 [Phellopilus nigrolimitatus]|nr:hypothetical protein DFH11DRAFT_1228740 [Phellopilus nigrolimitatus]KAH8109414.1 hypothetical protein DFH11DRAFT_933278 [Phellopilus nigrolimitatus]
MITLFDLPSKLDGKLWSPNTLKTRISLNYKTIPFTTEWVEYPDIETVIKRLGGAPTSKKPDGRDHYTLPAIHDSQTGKTVTDSIEIAAYLDKTYPSTPALFPSATRGAIEMFSSVFEQAFFPIFPFIAIATNAILNPPSEEYFRKTKKELLQKKLEELAPPGFNRDEIWTKVKEELEKIACFYDKNGEDSTFFLGNTFTFADAIVIGYLAWVQIVLGPESDEWRAVAGWSGGRWGKLLDLTKKWQV